MLSNIIALMLFSNPNWFAESVGAVAIDLEARTPLHSGDIPTTNKQPIAINCKGSGRCPAHPNYPVLESLLPFIDNVDDDYLFINGEHIVCNADPYVSVCAFFQRLPNVTESYFGAVSGADVKKLIPQLLDFGCKACGSVAVDNFNIENGELTVNVVFASFGCPGTCLPRCGSETWHPPEGQVWRPCDPLPIKQIHAQTGRLGTTNRSSDS